MNLTAKKNELMTLISKYLKNQADLESLLQFSWEIIDYFSKGKKSELPCYQNFEKEFWYAIWQIQHLADEEHEKVGITDKILLEALEFLEKKKKIPDAFTGTRP
jgi:hypothetical protein